MTYHITPINDLKPHEEKSTCYCLPSVEFVDNGDMLIVHNAFDERE